MRQLERGSLVDTWPLDGALLGVQLNEHGRRRIRRCLYALATTFECLEALEPETRTRLVRDLRACERVLRPRPRPWWVDALEAAYRDG